MAAVLSHGSSCCRLGRTRLRLLLFFQVQRLEKIVVVVEIHASRLLLLFSPLRWSESLDGESVYRFELFLQGFVDQTVPGK